jgi:RNA polymerase sigma-70 factor, ECF subfamily
MLEDALLIWKFNRGNKDVLERIYGKYKDDLMTLCVALLYDRNAAEDVVHDVFVKLISSCGKIQLKQSLKGYLITCIINAVRNKNKAGCRRESTSLEQVAEITSEDKKPDVSVMNDEQAQILIKALSRIPYQQREVLLLYYYSDLKFRAIAEIQNESLSTIQGRYRYGLTKLRSLLNGQVEK